MRSSSHNHCKHPLLRFAPAQVRHIMSGCWAADPSLRPGFDSLVIQLGGYMSRTDRQSYDARSRLDSGVYSEGASHLASGHHSQQNVSTPSTGTASKSSTRLAGSLNSHHIMSIYPSFHPHHIIILILSLSSFMSLSS